MSKDPVLRNTGGERENARDDTNDVEEDNNWSKGERGRTSQERAEASQKTKGTGIIYQPDARYGNVQGQGVWKM